MPDIDKILQEQLKKIKPEEKELEIIKKTANELIVKINKLLKGKAEAFIGGSLAKGTLIKREKYDIDIFVRFSEKYEAKASDLLFSALKKFKKVKLERIKASRDYFHLLVHENGKKILFEIVPTLYIKKPQEAKNTTDLSFFHIRYIEKCTKKKPKLKEDVMLCKSFCYSQNCYGAESHIRGFSGYALEVLVCHFGGLKNFLKHAMRWKSGSKVVLDPALHYKEKDEILFSLNEAKLLSPIVVVDPTYRERNITASLSEETFKNFVNACAAFLKTPNEEFFSAFSIDEKKFEKIARTKKAKFALLEAKCNKAREDIASAKLLKYFNFLLASMRRNEFKIFDKKYLLDGKAKFYIVFKCPSKKMIVQGPPLSLKEHVEHFKAKYKKTFARRGKIYARAQRKIITFPKFLGSIKKETELMGINIKSVKVNKTEKFK